MPLITISLSPASFFLSFQSRISEVTTHNSTLSDIVDSLGLVELNRVLYRCQDEEQDEGRGWGAYNVPNSGSLVYCGLQGAYIVKICV